MVSYIIRRLLLIIPTLFGILVLNFLIMQFAPGGPVEQILAQYSSPFSVNAVTSRTSGKTASGSQTQSSATKGGTTGSYVGAEGLDAELVLKLEKMFGFDKPAHIRFFEMIWNYIRFDFGEDFYRHEKVYKIFAEKLPVSISIGVWSMLIGFSIAIPLGIKKAVKDGTKFDMWSSTVVNIFNSIPGFLLAILMIVLFAGGHFFRIFPLRGLVSSNWSDLSLIGKILDYLWHMVLPILCITLTGLAGSVLMTKNFFLNEMSQLYVMTARSKGLTESRVLYGHVFRNAMIIIISGMPAMLIMMMFSGNLLIEIIFSLDGIGYLGFQAIMNRNYPIIFSSLYVFTLMGLVLRIVSDLMLTIIDPRIDFESRGA
jgi:microcin C transport system permease protein